MKLNLNKWIFPGKFRESFSLVFFLILCLAVLTRYELFNGFSILPGDRYDAVIVATILEHWFHVLSGQSNWVQVNYFFPYTRTIAQTDAYFLVGIAYAPFRILGLDPFLSTVLAGLVIKSSGFFGVYVLCRKFFSFSFYWALLAAALFTLSNGMTSHGQRIQLSTVAFAPIMAILLWSMFRAFLADNGAKFRIRGLVSGLFFGAWCLTCFYMAWFFAYWVTAFSVVALIMGGRSRLSVFKDRLVAHYGSVIFVVGSALVSLFPFIYAFLPKSREVGVRSYESVFGNTVPIEGILQVGNENILFGRLYSHVLTYISPGYSPIGEYYNTGFSVVLFFIFVCGCVYIFKHARQQSVGVLLASLVVASLVTWALTLNIFGYSGWFFVYHIFPGAKALNVVSVYQLLLALPVVIVAVKYLSMQRIPLLMVLLLSVLLLAEEINKPYLNLDRQAELARISLPHLPPEECSVFYTSGWEKQDNIEHFSEWINNNYAHNVSAMMLAQISRIPTINGMASFNPPDWNFGYPNKSDYDERVFSYSRKHGIAGLCKFDLNNKRWSVVNDFNPPQIPATDVKFFRKSAWPSAISSVHGLSSSESWGSWSAGDVVTLEFSLPLPPRFKVHLMAHAFGPNAGKEFVAHVGDSSIKFTLGTSPERKVLELINPQGSKIIKIDVPVPISPKALGTSGDERNLGIGFHELLIEPI